MVWYVSWNVPEKIFFGKTGNCCTRLLVEYVGAVAISCCKFNAKLTS